MKTKSHPIYIKILPVLLITLLFFGCKQTVSTDISKLGEHMNFETFKPESVRWVYSETKSKSGRFNLQAELYFTKETMQKLMDSYMLLSVTPKPIEKGELGFAWLDSEQQKKLHAQVNDFKKLNKDLNDYEAVGYDPYFFLKGDLNTGCFLVLDENTVLISLFSDTSK